jgi:hypothetical protein
MNSDQNDCFSDGKSVEEAQLEAAKQLLVDAGYKIVEPMIIDSTIDDQHKLWKYFYRKLYQKRPELTKNKGPIAKEKKIISDFVKSRMVGLNEKMAIQECVAIINTLFDYEDMFNLKFPINDIAVLSQGKFGWITDKALSIIHIKKNVIERKKLEKKIEFIEEETRKEIDLKDESAKLDAILKQMEADNG